MRDDGGVGDYVDFLLIGVLVAIALFALGSAIRRWWIERRPIRTSSLEGLERTVEAVVELLSEIAEPAGRGQRDGTTRRSMRRDVAERAGYSNR